MNDENPLLALLGMIVFGILILLFALWGIALVVALGGLFGFLLPFVLVGGLFWFFFIRK